MIAIHRSNSPTPKPQCTPNLLPCRVHQTGLVDASPRHWDPKSAEEGKKHSQQEPEKKESASQAYDKRTEQNNLDSGHLEVYFRGRKLKGKQIPVPKGYRGAVVREGLGQAGAVVQEEKAAINGYKNMDMDMDRDVNMENEGLEAETKVLDEIAEFDEVVVWGHEQIVDSNDGFIKGIAEWIPFAEAVSCLFEPILSSNKWMLSAA